MKYISSNADYIKTKQLLFGKYTKSLRMLGFDAWCWRKRKAMVIFGKWEGGILKKGNIQIATTCVFVASGLL